jgi:hypothetical protein
MAFFLKKTRHLTYHVDESVPVQDSPANSAACIPVEQGATVAASSLQVFHSKHSFRAVSAARHSRATFCGVETSSSSRFTFTTF